MEGKFLSVAELAELTGESVAVWRKRLARRELPWFKLGANVRVRETDCKKWLQGRMVDRAGEANRGCDSVQ